MADLSPAGKLIEQLRAGGLNYNRIAKALGRDSSLIGQIARGKKPGANLLEPLQALASGAQTIPEAARRVTKTGAVARVRQSAKAVVPAPAPEKIPFPRGRKDTQGRMRISRAYKSGGALEKQLQAIAAADGNVSVTLYFGNSRAFEIEGGSNNRSGVAIKRDGRSVRMWGHGGIRAALLLEKLEYEGRGQGLKSFLVDLAIENGLDLGEGAMLEGVRLIASYPERGRY